MSEDLIFLQADTSTWNCVMLGIKYSYVERTVLGK